MSCISIQGLATGGLLLAGALAVAAPAEGGVTALSTSMFSTVTAPPAGPVSSLDDVEDFASLTRSGSWGSISTTSTAQGYSFVASTSWAGTGEDPLVIEVESALVFSASTSTNVSFVYEGIEGSTDAQAILYLLDLEAVGGSGFVGPPLWTLSAGNVTVTIAANTSPRYAYLVGFSDTWSTPSGSTSSGGLSVTFTEIPAPGAIAGLGAMGLLGAAGRRRRG
jgi:hypothetical protein